MSRTNQMVVALAACVSACLAQSLAHVSVKTSSPDAPFGNVGPVWLSQIVTRLERSRPLPVPEGSWEDKIAGGDKLAAEATMNVAFVDFSSPRIETFPSADGDVLVVRWPSALSSVNEKALWAFDSPTEITYVIEATPGVFEARRLTEFYEKLLLWDQPPTKLNRINLAVTSPTEGEGGQIVGFGEFTMTSRGIYRWAFGAVNKNGRSWIAVSMSKNNVLSHSPVFPVGSVGVPERFPPLRSRLSMTSREALLSEIGKGYSDDLASYPRGRDAVVIAEMFSRGPLSESEIYGILFRGVVRGDVNSGEIVSQRIGVLLGNIEDRHELSIYAPIVANALVVGPELGWMGDAVIGHLFAAVERGNVDFIKQALALLRQERFAGGSLSYLSQHADVSIVDEIARIPLSPANASARDRTVETIKARLSK
jgi:hypothetical protein